ncbi:MAG: phospho-N-acetylmuramoyl-pentapeptide-transferase [Alphaproteobacteria bacterium 16-39-46]|nr:MAG: phospho-N-acetylmuramoyl-pentapeptide-transferase [Alphaproteobacteria bacterium 16-39-46]OZA43965.1 MAG: phospho-N-acetylmuramoyl-pentapeptide-transferase [Alphaproteobacteria bacterium 17-39-52]HQS83456.1 phospho-N-acetylmuramoyl-pentapeptide-transferase [Alphaproteobacteria bacterium]HQS93250.1 phospho-N-acetylmuramoyl-pentapeptide-transferase [Alphaproteobacteria bacterium]
MLYNLLFPLSHEWGFFNLFRYITFRTGGAMLTSLLISFYLGPLIIRWLKSKQKEGQPIRLDGPESHLLTKKGTPTMGGILILLSLLLSTLLWADLTNGYIWICLGITAGFGVLGFQDDYLKLTRRTSAGLSAKAKILLQLFMAGFAIFFILRMDPGGEISRSVLIPYTKNFMIHIGIFYSFFAAICIVGSSNAVNLTDGLDGLAIGPIIIAVLCFGLISYLVGNHVFATYLHIPFVPKVGELSVLCGALVGGSLGFLWFNAPPAQVFMGDTGSLSIGALLGTVAVITKHELILVIIGGLFVLEAASVIIQVGYFKYTKGKRIFLMAPLHHHFEKKGWAETTIVIRFWIIAIILALIGLASLKLR